MFVSGGYVGNDAVNFYPVIFMKMKSSVLSIKESILSNLNLFPNPVSNILHIETGNNNPIPEVKIYSIQGVLLIQTKGNQVDISMLARGIYMAEVEGVCKKVVKQ